jgi:hypothetical protein
MHAILTLHHQIASDHLTRRSGEGAGIVIEQATAAGPVPVSLGRS